MNGGVRTPDDDWGVSPEAITVTEIDSRLAQVEIVVPLSVPDPEVAMLRTAAFYLEQLGRRVPLLGFTTVYTDQPFPLVIGKLLYPVGGIQ